MYVPRNISSFTVIRSPFALNFSSILLRFAWFWGKSNRSTKFTNYLFLAHSRLLLHICFCSQNHFLFFHFNAFSSCFWFGVFCVWLCAQVHTLPLILKYYNEVFNSQAQEDAEVLRSLVIPLEEEIKALKEKLRATDEELQRTRSSGSAGVAPLRGSSSNTNLKANSGDNSHVIKTNQNVTDASNVDSDPSACGPTSDEPQTIQTCEMCKNYESQLVSSQNDQENLRKDIERFTEELTKEAALRSDLEEKWQQKRDKYKEHVSQLTGKVEHNERELGTLQKHYSTFKEEVNEEFGKLTAERENLHRHLNTLQDDNDFLAGRYLASSEEMENQLIDLPGTVEELQEALLQSHQSLIEARVGCEFEQRKCASYLDEIQVLRDQLQAAWSERQASDRDFAARLKSLE